MYIFIYFPSLCYNYGEKRRIYTSITINVTDDRRRRSSDDFRRFSLCVSQISMTVWLKLLWRFEEVINER